MIKGLVMLNVVMLNVVAPFIHVPFWSIITKLLAWPPSKKVNTHLIEHH